MNLSERAELHTRTPAATLYNRLLARTRLRQLQVIVLVAELGSVHHAAAAAGLTQSAATKMIAEVERVAGVALFERHARGMRLTFAGADVLPLLRRMLHLVTGCAESLAAVGAGMDGTVRVGAITAGVTGLLNPALPAFFDSQPQVHLELLEDALPVLLARYADGELDVLVVREPGMIAPDSQFQPLLADHYVVAGACGHPLAGMRDVQAADMLDYPWLTAPLDSQSHLAFEALFAGCQRLPPRQSFSTRSLVAIVHYLRESDALMVGPLSLLNGLIDNGTLVCLDHKPAHPLAAMGLLHRWMPRNRGVAAFCDHLLRTSLHGADTASPR
ncbi:LysR family transcriptional regulator [Achromobacter sp. GG226]|uniref:LysR family transcriptional regulator n=1 Tax=Verticiella alkaliphila TaxID=2779529 RepID=UPI001C0D8C47|nr:LysR family transcriptional regulator [Verticiella sp. GG226]MBU4612366.1 LysR family transcriptional regulator [Verticiella sp. GG226]